ncbi:hypothetical protein ANO11243_052990 [Dothideomycetidae sp. 11243]|nr:hypothetical protein ANO11243_052990 [fungal sp. No.11243]
MVKRSKDGLPSRPKATQPRVGKPKTKPAGDESVGEADARLTKPFRQRNRNVSVYLDALSEYLSTNPRKVCDRCRKGKRRCLHGPSRSPSMTPAPPSDDGSFVPQQYHLDGSAMITQPVLQPVVGQPATSAYGTPCGNVWAPRALPYQQTDISFNSTVNNAWLANAHAVPLMDAHGFQYPRHTSLPPVSADPYIAQQDWSRAALAQNPGMISSGILGMESHMNPYVLPGGHVVANPSCCGAEVVDATAGVDFASLPFVTSWSDKNAWDGTYGSSMYE